MDLHILSNNCVFSSPMKLSRRPIISLAPEVKEIAEIKSEVTAESPSYCEYLQQTCCFLDQLNEERADSDT